jgi:transcription initiation factor TFIIIB Brf1 subunit/transcription initiation factor TFIIB
MIKKCASCGSSNLVNDFGTYECKDCGLDNDIYHFKQQSEIKRLREALEEIKDYLSIFDINKFRIINKALEGGE